MSKSPQTVAERLNILLEQSGLAVVDSATAEHFSAYLALLLRWNARMNLTAIRDEDGILSRHFVESIACAQALPAGVATLLDFGSGAGFPGIPIAMCRREIAVTLAESQGKKAAFLREAVRTLGISIAVHADRAEALAESFDCVTLRAVDRMPEAIRAGSRLLSPGGWLALLTGEGELEHLQEFGIESGSLVQRQKLPGSERRWLALVRSPINLPV